MIRKILALSLIITILIPFSSASAITSQQEQSIYGDSEYYIPNEFSCGNGGSVVLVGSDNTQQAYNFFIQKGLTSFQAAAVVGNMYEQSHVDPTQVQDPPVGPGGQSNDPAAVTSDDGQKVGWGIVQWTPANKIIGEASTYNITAPLYDLSTQLEIVWDLMNGTSPAGRQDTLAGIEATTSLQAATNYFFENFEGGGNSPQASTQSDATTVLSLYGGSSENIGTTVTGSTSSCGNQICSSSSDALSQSTNESQLRIDVACLAEQQLSLWESQPGYNTADFPYAASGYLDYSQGVYEEWCADFVSWIYNQAEYALSSPDWTVPGVSTIQSIGEQGLKFTYHPAGSGYIPQQGDLAIYSGDSHVAIFISSSGGESIYIGGDGGSNPPYGGAQSGPVNGQWPYLEPTKNPPLIPSESIVDEDQTSGYWGDATFPIIGYVSPN